MTKMKFFAGIAGAAMLAGLSVPAAAVTPIDGSYAVDAFDEDTAGYDALDIAVGLLNGGLVSIADLEIGPQTFNLFTIAADEGSIQNDDLVPQDIFVNFTFTNPNGVAGSVGGQTQGNSFLGIFQNGTVTWNGAKVFDFGNGGQFQVELSDETFNSGVFGLGKKGATVQGTFSLISASVPEPSTWAMMILGIGMAGAAMRRRQNQTVRYNFA